MGVESLVKSYGEDLLQFIKENQAEKFKILCDKYLKKEKWIQKLCIADVKYKPTKQIVCPLIAAARLDDTTILRYMISKGVDVNFIHRSQIGRRMEMVTPLHVAVDTGNYDGVQGLLKANADCNIRDHNLETALHIAVKKADIVMARMMCSHGAQVNLAERNGNAPLHIATLYGHTQMVILLLKYDADVYMKGQAGAIPLHIAAREGHNHLIKLFGSLEVNINRKVPCFADQREKAPLHVAAENGHYETVAALLNNCHGDITSMDSDWQTALHNVVMHPYDNHVMREKAHYTETARILLEHQVDVEKQNAFGETALHLACMNHYQRIVELLLEYGADPHAKTNEGYGVIDVIPESDTVTRQIVKAAMEHPPRPRTKSVISEFSDFGGTNSEASSTLPLKTSSMRGPLGDAYAQVNKHRNKNGRPQPQNMSMDELQPNLDRISMVSSVSFNSVLDDIKRDRPHITDPLGPGGPSGITERPQMKGTPTKPLPKVPKKDENESGAVKRRHAKDSPEEDDDVTPTAEKRFSSFLGESEPTTPTRTPTQLTFEQSDLPTPTDPKPRHISLDPDTQYENTQQQHPNQQNRQPESNQYQNTTPKSPDAPKFKPPPPPHARAPVKQAVQSKPNEEQVYANFSPSDTSMEDPNNQHSTDPRYQPNDGMQYANLPIATPDKTLHDDANWNKHNTTAAYTVESKSDDPKRDKSEEVIYANSPVERPKTLEKLGQNDAKPQYANLNGAEYSERAPMSSFGKQGEKPKYGNIDDVQYINSTNAKRREKEGPEYANVSDAIARRKLEEPEYGNINDGRGQPGPQYDNVSESAKPRSEYANLNTPTGRHSDKVQYANVKDNTGTKSRKPLPDEPIYDNFPSGSGMPVSDEPQHGHPKSRKPLPEEPKYDNTTGRKPLPEEPQDDNRPGGKPLPEEPQYGNTTGRKPLPEEPKYGNTRGRKPLPEEPKYGKRRPLPDEPKSNNRGAESEQPVYANTSELNITGSSVDDISMMEDEEPTESPSALPFANRRDLWEVKAQDTAFSDRIGSLTNRTPPEFVDKNRKEREKNDPRLLSTASNASSVFLDDTASRETPPQLHPRAANQEARMKFLMGDKYQEQLHSTPYPGRDQPPGRDHPGAFQSPASLQEVSQQSMDSFPEVSALSTFTLDSTTMGDTSQESMQQSGPPLPEKSYTASQQKPTSGGPYGVRNLDDPHGQVPEKVDVTINPGITGKKPLPEPTLDDESTPSRPPKTIGTQPTGDKPRGNKALPPVPPDDQDDLPQRPPKFLPTDPSDLPTPSETPTSDITDISETSESDATRIISFKAPKEKNPPPKTLDVEEPATQRASPSRGFRPSELTTTKKGFRPVATDKIPQEGDSPGSPPKSPLSRPNVPPPAPPSQAKDKPKAGISNKTVLTTEKDHAAITNMWLAHQTFDPNSIKEEDESELKSPGIKETEPNKAKDDSQQHLQDRLTARRASIGSTSSDEEPDDTGTLVTVSSEGKLVPTRLAPAPPVTDSKQPKSFKSAKEQQYERDIEAIKNKHKPKDDLAGAAVAGAVGGMFLSQHQQPKIETNIDDVYEPPKKETNIDDVYDDDDVIEDAKDKLRNASDKNGDLRPSKAALSESSALDSGTDERVGEGRIKKKKKHVSYSDHDEYFEVEEFDDDEDRPSAFISMPGVKKVDFSKYDKRSKGKEDSLGKIGGLWSQQVEQVAEVQATQADTVQKVEVVEIVNVEEASEDEDELAAAQGNNQVKDILRERPDLSHRDVGKPNIDDTPNETTNQSGETNKAGPTGQNYNDNENMVASKQNQFKPIDAMPVTHAPGQQRKEYRPDDADSKVGSLFTAQVIESAARVEGLKEGRGPDEKKVDSDGDTISPDSSLENESGSYDVNMSSVIPSAISEEQEEDQPKNKGQALFKRNKDNQQGKETNIDDILEANCDDDATVKPGRGKPGRLSLRGKKKSKSGDGMDDSTVSEDKEPNENVNTPTSSRQGHQGRQPPLKHDDSNATADLFMAQVAADAAQNQMVLAKNQQPRVSTKIQKTPEVVETSSNKANTSFDDTSSVASDTPSSGKTKKKGGGLMARFKKDKDKTHDKANNDSLEEEPQKMEREKGGRFSFRPKKKGSKPTGTVPHSVETPIDDEPTPKDTKLHEAKQHPPIQPQVTGELQRPKHAPVTSDNADQKVSDLWLGQVASTAAAVSADYNQHKGNQRAKPLDHPGAKGSPQGHPRQPSKETNIDDVSDVPRQPSKETNIDDVSDVAPKRKPVETNIDDDLPSPEDEEGPMSASTPEAKRKAFFTDLDLLEDSNIHISKPDKSLDTPPVAASSKPVQRIQKEKPQISPKPVRRTPLSQKQPKQAIAPDNADDKIQNLFLSTVAATAASPQRPYQPRETPPKQSAQISRPADLEKPSPQQQYHTPQTDQTKPKSFRAKPREEDQPAEEAAPISNKPPTGVAVASKSDEAKAGDQPQKSGTMFFNVGRNWRDLAHELFKDIQGEKETQKMIKDIEKSNKKLSNRVNELMNRWRAQKGEDASIEQLQKALERVQLKYILDKVAKGADGEAPKESKKGGKEDKSASETMYEHVDKNWQDVARELFRHLQSKAATEKMIENIEDSRSTKEERIHDLLDHWLAAKQGQVTVDELQNAIDKVERCKGQVPIDEPGTSTSGAPYHPQNKHVEPQEESTVAAIPFRADPQTGQALFKFDSKRYPKGHKVHGRRGSNDVPMMEPQTEEEKAIREAERALEKAAMKKEFEEKEAAFKKEQEKYRLKEEQARNNILQKQREKQEKLQKEKDFKAKKDAARSVKDMEHERQLQQKQMEKIAKWQQDQEDKEAKQKEKEEKKVKKKQEEAKNREAAAAITGVAIAAGSMTPESSRSGDMQTMETPPGQGHGQSYSDDNIQVPMRETSLGGRRKERAGRTGTMVADLIGADRDPRSLSADEINRRPKTRSMDGGTRHPGVLYPGEDPQYGWETPPIRSKNPRMKHKRSSPGSVYGPASEGDNRSMGSGSIGSGWERHTNYTNSPEKQLFLFFKVSQNWKDLSKALFKDIMDSKSVAKMNEEIERKYPDTLTERVNEVMHRWWRKKGQNATIEELQGALDEVNLGYIREEIEDVISDSESRLSLDTDSVFMGQDKEQPYEGRGRSVSDARSMNSCGQVSRTSIDGPSFPVKKQQPMETTL
ncbi:unnamed protein product [Owenia fusiformis]|uniref:Uncharacterized protein n=1 Tax=Owenia fusiformis TaxID=6347 RepID=A0A8J1Y4I9_OWEFU|nr:unnamed protein product [Owenia fusiformis]